MAVNVTVGGEGTEAKLNELAVDFLKCAGVGI
jgi:hypothetical protein